MSALKMIGSGVLALLACPCCLSTSNSAVAAPQGGCCASSTSQPSREQQPDGSKAATKTAVFHIDGMTCGGCAAGVRKALQAVNGVRDATVDFEKRLATVHCEATVRDDSLVQAVSQAGFKATAMTFDRVYLRVDGMTCEACVAKVREALGKIGGVSDVSVALGRKRAAATVESGRVKPEALSAAIKAAGFQAEIIPTEKVCLRVNGMTCDKCVQRVTGSLSAIVGVEDTTVDLKTGLACVTREKGKAADAALRNVISDAGGSRHRFSAEVLASQSEGEQK